MNKKTLKVLILYMSLCFAFLSINTSNSTTIKMNETLDGTITINPAEPNGNFEWYITPVYATFHAEDDMRLAYIYYKVSTEGQMDPNWTQVDIRNEHTAKYNLTIKIDIDGVHTANFYAVDYEGNIGRIHTSNWIQIDMSSPEVSLNKEKMSLYEIKFTADASDSTSGIHSVKFYTDNNTEPANEDTTFPYEFIWSGIGNHTISAKASDYAGNEAITQMSTSKRSDFVFKTMSKKIENNWKKTINTCDDVTVFIRAGINEKTNGDYGIGFLIGVSNLLNRTVRCHFIAYWNTTDGTNVNTFDSWFDLPLYTMIKSGSAFGRLFYPIYTITVIAEIIDPSISLTRTGIQIGRVVFF